MSFRRPICVLALLGLWANCALAAGDLGEATTLKDEALKILQSGSALNTDPKLYAQAVVKLERAMAIVERAGREDSPLAQEISSALFWARRFTTLSILDEVERGRSAGSPPPSEAKVPDPPPVKKAGPPETPAKVEGPIEGDPLGDRLITEARKKFQSAQAFAREHKDDDYIVALRWFQVADQTAGTDYSIKALNLARKAQERHAARQKPQTPAVELPDTPEMRLVGEADALVAVGNYEGAFVIYKSSLEKKETVLAHRKLAHAYFDRAQQIKDELMPQFEAVQAEYRKAYNEASTTVYRASGGYYRRVNWSYPPLVAAKKKGDALMARAREALKYYDTAYTEFARVLELSPQNRDFDAAGHQGICYSVRGDNSSRIFARRILLAFLDNYKPADDIERTLYEFCRTEFARIGPKPILR